MSTAAWVSREVVTSTWRAAREAGLRTLAAKHDRERPLTQALDGQREHDASPMRLTALKSTSSRTVGRPMRRSRTNTLKPMSSASPNQSSNQPIEHHEVLRVKDDAAGSQSKSG